MMKRAQKRTIGILGYGSTGRYLCGKILQDPVWQAEFELSFVWNRDPSRLEDPLLPVPCRLPEADLETALTRYFTTHPAPDLIVEVCHPSVVQQHGAWLLGHADLFVASINALADRDTEVALRDAAGGDLNGHGLYLPVGAAWGVFDIIKMNELGTLRGLSVTMTFNAEALRLQEPLAGQLQAWRTQEEAESVLLFDGVVRDLAPLAPNNVNTMTCIALAGAAIGLDRTRARLIARKTHHAHVVEIEVEGPDGFSVHSSRVNPAKKGAVTGDQTYAAFLMSLKAAGGRGNGFFFC